VPQQHAARHPEDALFGVQFHPVGPQAIKRNAQVINLTRPFTFLVLMMMSSTYASTVHLMWS
jgi:hypothetical protein